MPWGEHVGAVGRAPRFVRSHGKMRVPRSPEDLETLLEDRFDRSVARAVRVAGRRRLGPANEERAGCPKNGRWAERSLRLEVRRRPRLPTLIRSPKTASDSPRATFPARSAARPGPA